MAIKATERLPVTITCEPELLDRLKQLAKAEDRQMTDMGRVLWREAIQSREQKQPRRRDRAPAS